MLIKVNNVVKDLSMVRFATSVSFVPRCVKTFVRLVLLLPGRLYTISVQYTPWKLLKTLIHNNSLTTVNTDQHSYVSLKYTICTIQYTALI